MDSFLKSAQGMASAAGKSAQKTKLKAEIEYQKSVIAGYQKEFGIAVFPAMRTQDTGKVRASFSRRNLHFFKRFNLNFRKQTIKLQKWKRKSNIN